ncbi:MAG: arylamine N-acetyltransferase family protein [Pyrinomonadaceae bacterium]
MDIEAYLKRINYHGSRAASAETLRDLQVAHLRSVPFENLSIHAGQPIVLDDNTLFEKIVTLRRGGFCYELNGLFAALLRALGFDVLMLSAGVAGPEGEWGPDFDHMALLVTLDERWLADVGFGDSFLEPLLLEEEREQVQGALTYKIVDDGSHLVLMRRQSAGDWEHQYRFTLQPYDYADYADMCLYHQTSSESHFTRKRVCTLATPEGRITLSDLRLISSVDGGGRQERALASEDEFNTLLRQHFGIQMTKMLA